MQLDMQIVAAGAVTSLGLDLASSTAALRAGLDNFQDTDFFAHNSPLQGARIFNKKNAENTIKGGTLQHANWLGDAIEECFWHINSEELKQTLIINISPHPEIPNLIDRQALDQHALHVVQTLSGLASENLQLLSKDSAAGGITAALICAQKWLLENVEGHVVITSVDSWLSLPRIQYALSHERLLTEEKAEGFIASEAAAAIVLRHARVKQGEGRRLFLRGIGNADEDADLLSQKPCLGDALAAATRDALASADIPIHTVDLRLSNLTGEEYFFEEASAAWARLLRQPMEEGYQWQQPATKLGNIGQAFDVFLIAYAYRLHQADRHPGNSTLVQLSSQQRLRSAIALRYC